MISFSRIPAEFQEDIASVVFGARLETHFIGTIVPLPEHFFLYVNVR
jgi:hypothetical protein